MWLLNRVEDRNGNYMTYEYMNGNTTFWLERVRYAGNANANIACSYSVLFHYSPRTDQERTFIGNNTFDHKRILDSITVKRSNTELYKYKFHFLAPNYSNGYYYHYLNQIDFSCGNKNYKPTTIVWNNNDYANTTTNCTHSIRLSNGTTPNYLDKTKFTGDFNGDGYTDFLLYYIDESNHKRASYHINKGLLNGQQVFQKLTTLTLDDNIDWIYVADLNGDGLDDIILSMRQDVFLFEDKVNIDAYITSIDANGNLSFTIADKDYGEFRIRSKYTESLHVGDFLGEGKQSLLVQECDLSKTGPRLFYITYTNNRLSSTQLPSEMVLDVDRMFACDFNGDGISEIYYSDADSVITGLKRLRRNNNGFYYEQVNNSMLSPWHQLFQGDFNGDGKVDLLTYTEDVLGNGNWYIQYFKETTLEWPAYSFSTNTMGIGNPGNHLCSFEYMTAPTYNYISVGDFNGDGKSDIAVRTSDDKMRFLYAPIRKVNDVAQFASVQNVNLSDMGLSDASNQSICIGNFLGHENLSFFSSQTLYSLHPLTNRYSTFSITDGMGNCCKFQYDYLMPILSGATVSAFYKWTRQTSDEQQNGMFTISLPIKAFSCLTTFNTNCPNREDEVFYSYQNALVHKLGRGFLGFEASKTETMQGGTPWQTTERYYGQCSPFTTPYLGLDTVVVKNDRGETVSSTEYTNKILYKQYQSNYNKKIFIPIVAKQVSDNYKLENTSEFLKKVIVENTYNDEVVNIGGETFRSYVILKQTDTRQGIDARSTVNSVDLCEFQSIKHTEYVNETHPLIVSWVINRPSKVLETSRRLGGYDDKKSLTVYSFPQGLGSHLFLPDTVTYYPSGIESPLDTLATRDVFVYHQTGSVEEKHHRDLAQNLPLQSSYYEYSSSGRFLTKKTNTAGYETNYEYNYNYGFLNKETDCNGLITRYVTTPLGDSSSVYYPNGTITNSGTSWVDRNDTNAPDDALYYKWEKSTGKGEKRTYFDATGAKLRTVTPGMTTELVYNDFLYNERGLLVCESLPYFGTDANAQIYWTRHEYDNYNRLMVTHYPDGLAESYLHHGLTTDHVYWTDPYVPSSTSTTTNVVGWTVESRDEDWNVVQYDYNADGTLKWTQIGDDVNTKVKVDYDDAGNRILIVDPDYGSTESLFNAYGQLVRTQTPKGNYTVYEYDSLGRLINRYEHDVESNKVDSTIYEYCSHPGKLGLLSLISFNGKKQNITYSYDIVNRLNFISELRYDKYYNTSYTYDFASRVTSVTYPTGFQIKKGYTPTGHLSILTDANDLVVWRTLGKTAAGQIERYTTADGLLTTRRYEPETGRLREILTLNGNDTIQYNSYGYDLIANLAARIDHVHGMNEEFIYDRLNRLTGIVEGNDTTAHFAYDAYGRMLSKRSHSAMVFDSASYNAGNRPHAIAQARTAEDLPMQYMSYTHFDKLSHLQQDTLALDYTYGFEHQRLHLTETNIYGDTLREKDYVGNCEFINDGHYTTAVTYLTGPLGVFGVQQSINDGRPYLFFVHPDHLGSWNLVTDRYANVVQDVTFDAWGTPFQFGANGLESADTLLFDRGFTGHEHLSYFGLINMNGRMYDPFTSGFLSVDNYVQNPDYTQCFNRYSYCFNNPLKYTDPDGENPLLFIAKAYFLFFTETGYELQKYLNFAAFHFDVHLSTEQMGIGFDVSVGVPKAAYLSYRAHFGSTYYWKHYDNSFKGLEMRYGGEWTAFSVLNYSGTAFKSGETSQTTKAITLGGPYANIRYENDYMFDLGKYFPGVPDDDHGDRYRTAAARIKLGAATVGVNLFTGDPGHYWDDRKVFNGPDYNNRDTYVINDAGDNPDQYRSGVFYVGLGSIKLGWNSEGIRHCFQNIVAHDWIDQGGSPYFKVLNIRPRFYIYFGTSTGNTLW